MKHHYEASGIGVEKICPICGELFIIRFIPDWFYKDKNKKDYYCSYTCWRKGAK